MILHKLIKHNVKRLFINFINCCQLGNYNGKKILFKHTYTHVCVYICLYVYICVNMYLYGYLHKHVFIYICTYL